MHASRHRAARPTSAAPHARCRAFHWRRRRPFLSLSLKLFFLLAGGAFAVDLYGCGSGCQLRSRHVHHLVCDAASASCSSGSSTAPIRFAGRVSDCPDGAAIGARCFVVDVGKLVVAVALQLGGVRKPCGSARAASVLPPVARRCPSPRGSAARAAARWQCCERCASSWSELSSELHQSGLPDMRLM